MTGIVLAFPARPRQAYQIADLDVVMTTSQLAATVAGLFDVDLATATGYVAELADYAGRTADADWTWSAASELLAEVRQLHYSARLAALEETFIDVRPLPTTCECSHGAHRPCRMFGPNSTFRVASFEGHATDARLRSNQVWIRPSTSTGPRVCESCHLAGHATADTGVRGDAS